MKNLILEVVVGKEISQRTVEDVKWYTFGKQFLDITKEDGTHVHYKLSQIFSFMEKINATVSN